jgi:hypothetical protein
MADRGGPDSPRSPVADYLAHAEFHARESPAGIGAAVTNSMFDGDGRSWNAVVTDGGEWHYVRVVGVGVGPFPDLASEVIEEGIQRFASGLPAAYRIRHLINANPLHVDRDGNVDD